MNEWDDSQVGAPATDAMDRKLNKVSGGLVLIWAGFTLLVRGGWGVGLAGVGAIIIGEQLARKFFAARFERQWAIAGIFLLGGGIVIQFGLTLSLVPALFIVIGITLLVSALRRE